MCMYVSTLCDFWARNSKILEGTSRPRKDYVPNDTVDFLFETSVFILSLPPPVGLRRRQGRGRRAQPHARSGAGHPLARTPPAGHAILRRRPVRHPVSNTRGQHVPVSIRHERRHAFLARPFR